MHAVHGMHRVDGWLFGTGTSGKSSHSDRFSIIGLLTLLVRITL